MTYVQAYANQNWQIGQETSAGGGGGAGHKLLSFAVVPTHKLNVAKFKAPGHHNNTETALEQQWFETAINGDMSFTEVLWLIEAMYGAGTKTTPGGATLARQRVYTPPLTGAVTPKTFETQWGDSNDVKQALYNLIKDMTFKFDRAAGMSVSGAGYSALQSHGGSFTATPTALANKPMSGSMLNFYFDTTGAGIGGTQQQLSFQSATVEVKGLYDVYWDSDRSQPTWATHVNDTPTTTVKVDLNENDNTRTLVSNLLLNQTYFLRIDVQDAANSIETNERYTFQWDLALRLTDLAPYGTKQKVLYREATFELIEDATWGKAHVITSITGEDVL